MGSSFRIAALLAAATALSGCAVAALPVVAGGAIVNKAHLRKRHRQAAAPVAPSPVAAPAPATVLPPPDATAPAAAVVEAVPADRAAMVPGRVYAGALPFDRAAAAVLANAPAAAAEPGGASVPAAAADTGWGALGRFVAATMASPTHGALLARGSDAAAPRWAPCVDKPRAVLAPLSLLTAAGWTPAERAWIGAIPTMGATLVLVGIGAPDAGALKAVADAVGVPAFVPEETLFTAATDADLPAVRATVAARYCVVAVAGRRAADFPNGLLPTTTPPMLAGQWNAGWFLFPPPR